MLRAALNLLHQPPILYCAAKLKFRRPPNPEDIPLEEISLANIRDIANSRTKKQRKGRGLSSGRGRYCGRGKSRSGKAHRGWQGGQTPLHIRIPKAPITDLEHHERMFCISLADLQVLVDTGRLDPSTPITPVSLKYQNIIKDPPWPGVRLTADGYDIFQAKLDVQLNWCDPDAVRAIEARGGTAQSVYHSQADYAYHMNPHKWPERPLVPELPGNELWRRYEQPDIRGYLNQREDLWRVELDKYSVKWTPEMRSIVDELTQKELARLEALEVEDSEATAA
eukprot:NODE_3435_length_969_cov_32.027316_g3286_i0.p1 GENE.NODE_3435_length_969_cov_32.027316_g3286_i0~~NODE_3435_length_969_cov_32.027316_g3286_i0.p1  ORF type:complete len:301 (-),score=70.21 NODE_3435_length_969_cov_32.027316_g3286_i0:65-907(-)